MEFNSLDAMLAVTPVHECSTKTTAGRCGSGESTASSIYSNDSSSRSTSTKTSKRVRFDEYASWSYFDAELNQPVTPGQPAFKYSSGGRAQCVAEDGTSALQRRASSISLRQGWQRFKQQSSGIELEAMWNRIRQRNWSLDSDDSHASGRSASTYASSIVRQPLREASSNRKFRLARTAYDPSISVAWQTKPPPAIVVRGDWNELLGLR